MPKKNEELDTSIPDHFGSRFGRLVRSYREDLGISAKKLAKLLWDDVSRASSIYRLEGGKVRNPRAETIQHYAYKLEIPQEDIDALREPNTDRSMLVEISREIAAIRDGSLGASDPPMHYNTASNPTSVDLCISELKTLDGRLDREQTAGSEDEERVIVEAKHRRTYLIAWLEDELRADAHPEDHAKSMASLLHIREWNSPCLRRLKADYNPIGLEFHKRVDPRAPFAIEFVLELVANTYLNDDKASARALLRAHKDILIRPKTLAEFEIAERASGYMVEVGGQHPEKMKLLLTDLGPEEVAMTLSKWYRCFACRLSTEGFHELSKDALKTATDELKRAKGHPEYTFVDAYMQALIVVHEWRTTQTPTKKLLKKVKAAERAITEHVIEDSPIRAALSVLKIEITIRRCEEIGEELDRSEILTWAGNAESMLLRSVPGYCLISVADLLTEVRAVLDHRSDYFKRTTRKRLF